MVMEAANRCGKFNGHPVVKERLRFGNNILQLSSHWLRMIAIHIHNTGQHLVDIHHVSRMVLTQQLIKYIGQDEMGDV
ncbi:hypothetical protein BK127_26005 [Paenibacillus sp. FSL H7-0331]|nr:hypothetical protein BK127_26005 [Paenibacillus sp. FSL H7-0331]